MCIVQKMYCRRCWPWSWPVWPMAHCPWPVATGHGPQAMGQRPQAMAHGQGPRAHGPWPPWPWPMACGPWHVAHGPNDWADPHGWADSQCLGGGVGGLPSHSGSAQSLGGLPRHWEPAQDMAHGPRRDANIFCATRHLDHCLVTSMPLHSSSMSICGPKARINSSSSNAQCVAIQIALVPLASFVLDTCCRPRAASRLAHTLVRSRVCAREHPHPRGGTLKHHLFHDACPRPCPCPGPGPGPCLLVVLNFYRAWHLTSCGKFGTPHGTAQGHRFGTNW